jgi:hypothetical protein
MDDVAILYTTWPGAETAQADGAAGPRPYPSVGQEIA